MCTCRQRRSAGGQPARSQVPRSSKSSSIASSGRPTISSARQASGPGALPWHALRALLKLVVSGKRHLPGAE
eukprot:1223195-Alexandrium_andersonii.AAC.1